MIRNLLTTAILTAAAWGITGNMQAAQAQMDHSKMDHSQMDHKKMDHGQMDHGAMGHDAKPGVTEADGVGVINAIDGAKKQVNLTHEPMPALGWPTMTMDLPVSGKVDLDSVKAGDKVTFRLKLGRDKVYRIMEIAPAK